MELKRIRSKIIITCSIIIIGLLTALVFKLTEKKPTLVVVSESPVVHLHNHLVDYPPLGELLKSPIIDQKNLSETLEQYRRVILHRINSFKKDNLVSIPIDTLDLIFSLQYEYLNLNEHRSDSNDLSSVFLELNKYLFQQTSHEDLRNLFISALPHQYRRDKKKFNYYSKVEQVLIGELKERVVTETRMTLREITYQLKREVKTKKQKELLPDLLTVYEDRIGYLDSIKDRIESLRKDFLESRNIDLVYFLQELLRDPTIYEVNYSYLMGNGYCLVLPDGQYSIRQSNSQTRRLYNVTENGRWIDSRMSIRDKFVKQAFIKYNTGYVTMNYNGNIETAVLYRITGKMFVLGNEVITRMESE